MILHSLGVKVVGHARSNISLAYIVCRVVIRLSLVAQWCHIVIWSILWSRLAVNRGGMGVRRVRTTLCRDAIIIVYWIQCWDHDKNLNEG